MKKTYRFKNNDFIIADDLIDIADRLHIELGESYFNYLTNYYSPYLLSSLSFNFYVSLSNDLTNKLFLSQSYGYGRIIKYDLNGTIVDYYNNFYDAVFSTDNSKKYKFGLEKYEKNGLRPFKTKVDFYGTSISESKTSETLIKMNKLINKEIYYFYENDKRFFNNFNDKYLNDKSNGITFEEFRKKASVWSISFIGTLCNSSNKNFNITEYSLRNSGKANKIGYENELNRFLNRYNLSSNHKFEKVTNLNDYKNKSGIYLLCIQKENAFYVGKSSVDLKDRILSHFNSPKSFFDETHKPSDIDEIYIFQCSKNIIDTLEIDCINYIKKDYLLNICYGGGSLEFLKNIDANSRKTIKREKLKKLFEL